MPTEPRLADFPAVSDERWMEAVRHDVGERDPDGVLTWTTADGVALRAFYRRSGVVPNPVTGRTGAWEVVEDLTDVPDDEVVAAATRALEGGADRLRVGAGAARKLVAQTVPLHVTGPGVTEVLSRLGPGDRADVDPFSACVAGRADPTTIDAFFDRFKAPNPAGVRACSVDLSGLGHSGDVTRLALAFGAVAEWTARLGPRAAGGLHVTVPLQVSLFRTIAGVRALRIGIARILTAFGTTETAVPVTGIVPVEALTTYAVHNNLLRITLAAAAGVIAGCDAVCLPAFDAPHGPTERGRRLSRNVHHVLREEGQLHRIHDPAAGAWYIEEATRQVGEAAWDLFRRWESAGGLAAALATGEPRDRLRDEAAAERAAVDTRGRILVGVNDFPGPDPVPPGGSLRDDLSRLRAAVQRAPRPPLALLVRLGDPKRSTVRARFVQNFLGCASIRTEDSESDDPGSVVREVERTEAAFVVVCGDDELYAPWLSALGPDFPAIRVAAGRPPNDDPSTWHADECVYLQAPLTATLTRLAARCGIRPEAS